MQACDGNSAVINMFSIFEASTKLGEDQGKGLRREEEDKSKQKNRDRKFLSASVI